MLFFCALFGKKEAEIYKIQVKSQENFSQEQEEPAQGEAVQQAVPQEGTVAAAVFVGLIARGLNRFLVPLGNKLYAICRK